MQKHFDKLSASKNGFTIIELIVVIAIIAVLAGIVLVNVQKYIIKSKDASTKAQMKEYIKNAAVYYEKNNSSYAGLGADPTASNLYVGMQYNTPSPGWVAPIISANNFCLRVKLNSGGQWCGDNSGNVKAISDSQFCTSTDGYITFYCP